MSESPPLSGLRVVDFCWVWAGPLMTAMLADLGAEVIKIESRSRLDGTRLGRPLMYADLAAGDDGRAPELQPLNHGLNRGKRSFTVDMRNERGVELLRSLVARSDVVCDNFRAGVMNRRGLGYEQLREVNPDVIALSLSGAGQFGPWNHIATYAPTVCSLAGLSRMMGYEGEEPLGRIQAPYGDTNAGLYGVLAILDAITRRDRGEGGAFLDLSQWEAAICGLEEALLDFQMNGREHASVDNESETQAPHDNFPCRESDTWISIAVGSDPEWAGLCAALEAADLPAHPRFADRFRRWKNRAELGAAVAERTRGWAAPELEARLRERGVGAATVKNIGDQFADPHLQARGDYVYVNHPLVGEELIYGNPWRFSRTVAVVQRSAPLLGEANDYVLRDILGLADEEIGELEEIGAIE
jgi:benzylsuccinate CoA-transferase BbsF subunit